jgi:DNA-binding LacI/PurR family transcriptional regulator
VATDLDVLAREALRLLLRRVDGADGTAERIAVPWRIEVRESTAGRHAVAHLVTSA